MTRRTQTCVIPSSVRNLNWRFLPAVEMTCYVRAFCWVLTISALALSAASGQSGTYDWAGARSLGSYQGIKRAFVSVATPRKMNINCLRIDMTTPGLTFATTGRMDGWVDGVSEAMTKTTRQFIRESQSTSKKLAVAINAAPWDPFVPGDWNASRPVNLSGLAVSEGVLVSPGAGTPSFVVSKTGQPSMSNTNSDTSITDIQTAVSGFGFVLNNGIPTTGDTSIHPRTGIGISKDGRYVYLMTIDGRQSASIGATTDDVGSWLKYFGSHTGINMDGGGSTTMAWWDPSVGRADKTRLLNSPRGNGWKWSPLASERHNGSNLGVHYADKE